MSPTARMAFNTKNTLFFIFILSTLCALILSALAAILEKPKEFAKDLDRSKEMMIAAKIYDPGGFFTVEKEGKIVPAKYESGGLLTVADQTIKPTQQQILEVYERRLHPYLTNDQGDVKSFSELGIDLSQYLADFRKTGYYKEPWKLFYKILPNEAGESPIAGYVIPVNGYGLWDAIYGYIALEPDADTVIGISWYDQKETPGLGGNISETSWQSLFPGKKIFQKAAASKTDFKTAPLGITVVKGKVAEVLGSSPKAESAVDGMAGATLTGNGVTDAYKTALGAYRPFLIKMHNQNGKK